MVLLDETFWSGKYQKGKTGWDIGYASTPLKEYSDQLKDKSIKILIPGGGNAYEAEYLHHKGFTHVYVVDLSRHPLENLKSRVPDFPEAHLIHGDFFDLQDAYDLIIEQTFFCALLPEQREDYVQKMNQLLKPGGKLVGLLFDRVLNTDHPPFGGSKKEYQMLFQDTFTILKLEEAYNSIPPRMGSEVFIMFQKP